MWHGGGDWTAANGESDWNAGVPACMSAKHEKALATSDLRSLTSLKNATLQAGTPAFQSHPPVAALQLASAPSNQSHPAPACRWTHRHRIG
jgi:hypothetical protein